MIPEKEISTKLDCGFCGRKTVECQLYQGKPECHFCHNLRFFIDNSSILNNNNPRLDVIFETVLAFNNVYFPDWDNIHYVYYSNAIAGEVGEICNLTKKMAGGGTKKLDRYECFRDITREIPDLFIYLIMLCYKMGLDAEKVNKLIMEKILINISRMEKRIK